MIHFLYDCMYADSHSSAWKIDSVSASITLPSVEKFGKSLTELQRTEGVVWVPD